MKKLCAFAGGTALVAGLGFATPSVSAAAPAPSGDPAAAARGYIQENPARILGSSEDSYTVVDTVSAGDTSHVRFTRSYDGLPVLGGDFVVHLTGSQPDSLSLAQDRKIRTSTTPRVKADQAEKSARDQFSGKRLEKSGKAKLVIDARQGEPALAWQTTVTGVQADGQTPSRQIIVTDAATGKVRSEIETITTPIRVGQKTNQGAAKPSPVPVAATGTGRGIFIGSVQINTSGSGSNFSMTDTVNGNGNTCDLNNRQAKCTTFTDADNTWGNGTQSDRASAGVDAHYGATKTFEYFKNVHSRNGIFDNGVGVPSRVHYGRNYVNAFWDGRQMTYGDGADNLNPLVALDIAGHEMSHGVTENTANLNYSGDAGGLNEATSDIFGTMVEFYANNTSDAPDFLIGEKVNIRGNGTPLRYMDQPSRDGVSFDCWSSAVPGSDPHYSSGVGNHFFFLLANGSGQSSYGNSPTCDGSTVAGIGRDKAAAIWFKALSEHMVSTETYAQARLHTVAAATDLYGATSAEVAAAKAAWSAVSVN